MAAVKWVTNIAYPHDTENPGSWIILGYGGPGDAIGFWEESEDALNWMRERLDSKKESEG